MFTTIKRNGTIFKLYNAYNHKGLSSSCSSFGKKCFTRSLYWVSVAQGFPFKYTTVKVFWCLVNAASTSSRDGSWLSFAHKSVRFCRVSMPSRDTKRLLLTSKIFKFTRLERPYFVSIIGKLLSKAYNISININHPRSLKLIKGYYYIQKLTSRSSSPLWLKYSSSNAIHASRPLQDVSLLLWIDNFCRFVKACIFVICVILFWPNHSSARLVMPSRCSMVFIRLLPSSRIRKPTNQTNNTRFINNLSWYRRLICC